MKKFILIENIERRMIDTKLLNSVRIDFILELASTSFFIYAKEKKTGKTIGKIYVSEMKDQKYKTFFVKSVGVDEPWKKKPGETDSVAKVLYTKAREVAKSLGGQVFSSDVRLSPDSTRNWEKMRMQGDAAVNAFTDSSKYRWGKSRYDSLLEEV